MSFIIAFIGCASIITIVHGSVKCFCDKRNCEDSLICSGKWCLVGFKNEVQVRLDQLCATDDGAELEKCAIGWNGWSEVCSCSDDFCNTFAYLRGSIEQHQQQNPNNRQLTNTFVDGLYSSNSDSNDHHQRTQRIQDGGSIFDDGASTNGNDMRPPRYQSNNLIVLLVIIPLSVGGLAVCLIFVNYHCKLN